MDELIHLKMFNEKVRIDLSHLTLESFYRRRSDRARRVRFFDMIFYDEVIHNLCMCLYR